MDAALLAAAVRSQTEGVFIARRRLGPRGFTILFALSLAAALASLARLSGLALALMVMGSVSSSESCAGNVDTGVGITSGVAFAGVPSTVRQRNSETPPITASATIAPSIATRFGCVRTFGMGTVGCSDGSFRYGPIVASGDGTVMFAGSHPPSTSAGSSASLP